MTDFDTEMLHEKEAPAPLAPDKEELRVPPKDVVSGDRALAAAVEQAMAPDEMPAVVAEPAEEPARQRRSAPELAKKPARETRSAPEPAKEEARAAGKQDAAGRAAAEEERRAEATDAEAASAARRQQAARRRALTWALARLLRDPAAAMLAPLMEAYRSASEAEAEQAATAVTTLYLRAETEERRRLRPVLSEAIRRAHDTELAQALQRMLGAIALPRPAPPPPAPPPTGARLVSALGARRQPGGRRG
jgi:hypothetical protein